MITVIYSGEMSDLRKAVFQRAASRWDTILDTSFDPVTLDGVEIDGVVIRASIDPIDGEAGVLGQAGPTVLAPQSGRPLAGVMQFDLADVLRLEQQNSFEDVVLHEMGHVLGFGTLWTRFGLVSGSGTVNPRFTGNAATSEYGILTSDPHDGVPIANTGGAGTREGHWRELIFGDELLTGFLSGSSRPISRMSVASFADMGYRVDLAAADPFDLPSFRDLAQMGLMEAVRACDLCRMARPEPVVLGAQG
ncbi:leishmanolysin-related zinc metalloendopeptidase [Pontibaca salina]|uniref:Peptidase n=1 Tax=Pontibaca salina TaxID=2795731 RepID=A0A934HLE8_9RHOB|nr:leishmanolysin-related zinc metalloendopeptidase [Pontibaca salina]MBI6629026.1 hypothetical protein [Pontibaca salina]